MTAKEYLSRYRFLKLEIDAKQERIDELEARAQSVSSPSFSGVKTTSPKGEAKHEHLTDDCDALKAELVEENIRLTNLQREIEHVIAKVEDDKERRVLELRYLNCLPFFKVAARLHYSLDNIYTIHRKALENLTVPNS